MERQVSGIILTGGRSSRMGCDKAKLLYRQESFLQYQAQKLRGLGIDDIVIAGPEDGVPGTRCVPDCYPGMGPLGGIHAALQAAKYPLALVLAVDTPLVPAAVLERLLLSHGGGATVLSLHGAAEPLIGVYDKALASLCEIRLREGKAALRLFLQEIGAAYLEYEGDPFLLTNCNTLEEYRRLLQYAASAGSAFAEEENRV